MVRSFIGVANSWTDVVSGHVNLDRLTQAVKIGVRWPGVRPFEFHTMVICDGLATWVMAACATPCPAARWWPTPWRW